MDKWLHSLPPRPREAPITPCSSFHAFAPQRHLAEGNPPLSTPLVTVAILQGLDSIMPYHKLPHLPSTLPTTPCNYCKCPIDIFVERTTSFNAITAKLYSLTTYETASTLSAQTLLPWPDLSTPSMQSPLKQRTSSLTTVERLLCFPVINLESRAKENSITLLQPVLYQTRPRKQRLLFKKSSRNEANRAFK
jgi:hypothetical protein